MRARPRPFSLQMPLPQACGPSQTQGYCLGIRPSHCRELICFPCPEWSHFHLYIISTFFKVLVVNFYRANAEEFNLIPSSQVAQQYSQEFFYYYFPKMHCYFKIRITLNTSLFQKEWMNEKKIKSKIANHHNFFFLVILEKQKVFIKFL